MSHPSTVTNTSKADFPIDPQFTERWSPHAYMGEVVSEADVMKQFPAGDKSDIVLVFYVR